MDISHIYISLCFYSFGCYLLERPFKDIEEEIAQ